MTARRRAGVRVRALVGRPNVGKSTLFNRLIGEDRSVVHDMPGTTRDAIDTVVDTEHGPIRFVDTAGMRRKARIEEGTEYFSFVRALQGRRLLRRRPARDRRHRGRHPPGPAPRRAHRRRRLPDRGPAQQVGAARHRQPAGGDLRDRPEAGLPRRERGHPDLGAHRRQRAPPPARARRGDRGRTTSGSPPGGSTTWSRAQSAQPAPHGARILYATQGATDPPTFTLFANKELPATYLRYIERKLREAFDLGATPIKLRVRQRRQPTACEGERVHGSCRSAGLHRQADFMLLRPCVAVGDRGPGPASPAGRTGTRSSGCCRSSRDDVVAARRRGDHRCDRDRPLRGCPPRQRVPSSTLRGTTAHRSASSSRTA